MKTEKIKSIDEAFSMQPNSFRICSKEKYRYISERQIVDHEHNDNCVKEIVVETRQVDSDKQCNYYVGYNFNGDKLFEYLQSSVNVHYENKK